MKSFSLFIALIILGISSCRNEISKKDFIGSWKLLDTLAGDPGIKRVTFSKENILILETIINGQVYEKMNMTYELTPDHKFLISKRDTSEFKFEIIKITAREFEIKPANQKRIFHYARLNS